MRWNALLLGLSLAAFGFSGCDYVDLVKIKSERCHYESGNGIYRITTYSTSSSEDSIKYAFSGSEQEIKKLDRELDPGDYAIIHKPHTATVVNGELTMKAKDINKPPRFHITN